MSDTTLSVLDISIPEVWSADVLVAGEKQQFWYQFDTIHIITVGNLTGTGVTGETQLSDAEEALPVGQITLTMARLRHAVRFTRDAYQRSILDCRTVAKGRLSYWLADKLDSSMFTVAITGATYTIFAGSATTVSDLGTGNVMSPTVISRARMKLLDNKALPIRTSRGNRYYALVMHGYDEYNLKVNSTYVTNLQTAAARGEDNAIFTGALGILDGMILFSAQNSTNATSKSKSVAFGGEAFARAYGQYPDWVEEYFDYKEKLGIATSVVYGDARAVEANSVVVNTYAADPNA